MSATITPYDILAERHSASSILVVGTQEYYQITKNPIITMYDSSMEDDMLPDVGFLPQPPPPQAVPIVDDLGEQLDLAFRQSVEAIEPAWQRGDLTPEKIAKAIAEYRSEHPYRRP